MCEGYALERVFLYDTCVECKEKMPTYISRCYSSSVGIATGYGGGGVRFTAGTRNFSLFHRAQTRYGAHTTSYLMGTGALYRRVKRETDQPSSSAEVKMVVLYLHSTIRLHGVVLN
jgi:hypothetical protein